MSINHLKVFGSKVVILDKVPNKCKLSPKGLSGRFLNYAQESKAYKI